MRNSSVSIINPSGGSDPVEQLRSLVERTGSLLLIITVNKATGEESCSREELFSTENRNITRSMQSKHAFFLVLFFNVLMISCRLELVFCSAVDPAEKTRSIS